MAKDIFICSVHIFIFRRMCRIELNERNTESEEGERSENCYLCLFETKLSVLSASISKIFFSLFCTTHFFLLREKNIVLHSTTFVCLFAHLIAFDFYFVTIAFHFNCCCCSLKSGVGLWRCDLMLLCTSNQRECTRNEEGQPRACWSGAFIRSQMTGNVIPHSQRKG